MGEHKGGADMIEALVIEGLIRVAMEFGMDQLIDRKPQDTIDLTPVTAALEKLNQQSLDIFRAISHPTETQGEEMCERAVTAFTKGWYEDALRDALKSIDIYPYSGKPRLVGGLAALSLGKGDEGLELLISSIKYSANGQPEAGAIAAIVASQLALKVGASKLAGGLLKDADQLTNGRCPAVVGALWKLSNATGSSSEERLKQLWWDDHKLSSTDYSNSLLKEVLKSATTVKPEYLTAGGPFLQYLDEIAGLARSNLAALDAVGSQLNSFVAARNVDIGHPAVKKALSRTDLKPVLGFLDTTVGDLLVKCKSLPGAANWPGDSVWKSPSVLDLSSIRDLFIYVQRTCERLLEALNQLPTLATDQSRLLPTDQAVVKAALPHYNSWITALSAVQAAADLDIANRAIQARDMYLETRRIPKPEPVMHLEGLGGGLFAVAGGLVPDTRQLAPGQIESFTCPGCKFRHQKPKSTQNTYCPSCGKEVVYRRCSVTNQNLMVLSEWTAWTHPGCTIRHSINPTSSMRQSR